MRSIYIYAGPGTSPVALKHTEYTLKNLVHSDYSIQKIGPQEVIEGKWISQAALFVMPGGEDIPYEMHLNGKGNRHIKEYVTQGGAYLGLCAGAYYGSKKVVFALGTEQEVVGERELAFFPGTAVGPTLQPWDRLSNAGACVAFLEGRDPLTPILSKHPYVTYVNGGGHFPDADKYPDVTVLATYSNVSCSMPALIEISSGKGRVILSGVHCEFAPELFDNTDPYLLPIQKELILHDSKRLALMRHLLERLGVMTNDITSIKAPKSSLT